MNLASTLKNNPQIRPKKPNQNFTLSDDIGCKKKKKKKKTYNRKGFVPLDFTITYKRGVL